MADTKHRKKAALKLLEEHINGEESKAPKLNVSKARAEYRMQYEFKRQHSKPTDFNSNITQNSSAVFASETPFSSLSRIGIKDLRVHIPAKGSYLLLRTIEPPIQVVGIMLFVEDHLGRVIIVTLYNFIDYNFPVPIEEVLPVGTVLVIKEPYLKLAASGQIVIRCDCPTDVILIDQSHPVYQNVCNIKWKNSIDSQYLHEYPSTAIEWKERGNMLYNQRNFGSSLQAYFSALEMTNDPQLVIILQLNICAAYLEFGYFEKCIKYAKLVLQSQSDNLKAVYRAGRSHYSLGQFSEALTMYERVLELDSSHANSLMEEKRCIERLKEQNGTFDVYKLYLTSLVKPNALVDFGEYVGSIEVAPIKGKGKGVIATQNIKPGTFLLVSKAFQAVFDTTLVNGVAVSINCDFTMDHGDKVKLLAQTCQMVMKNPKTFGKKFYSLSTNDPEIDSNPKVFCDDSEEEPIADANRIRKILTTNCFSLLPVKDQVASFTKEQLTGSGLFIYGSYFNHSCIANANWATYNDVIAIRSKKFIKKGDEITINYSAGREDFLQKEEKFFKWCFMCKCILCRLDRSEPRTIHQKRAELETAHQNLTDEHYADTLMPEVQKQMNKVKRELEMTYAQRSALNIKLFDCYMRVAISIAKSRDKDYPSRLVDVVDKALSALGLSCELLLRCVKDDDFSLPEDALLCEYSLNQALVFLIYHFQITDHSQLAHKWAKVLVKIHHLFTGGSIAMLKSQLKGSHPDLHTVLLRAIE